MVNLCWHLTTKSEVLELTLVLGFNFKAARLVGLRFRWSFGFWVVSGEDRDCRRNISSSSFFYSTLYSLLSSLFPAMLSFFVYSIWVLVRERGVWKWKWK